MLIDWWNSIAFAYPWVLPLLLVVPFMGWHYYKSWNHQQASFTITTLQFLQQPLRWSAVFVHTPIVIRGFAIVFLVFALARPQQKFTEQFTEGEGIDIVLCFDISGSMTEKDFLPNRLEASKQVAAEFVNNRIGDRIGVVIFSNQSFTLCPITTDKNAILQQINNIQSGYLETEGTAIGSGLATSVERLKNSKTKSKIIILLTDGVDFGGIIPPDIAKEMAKLYNIKVYTIGVGSEKEVDTEIDTDMGRITTKKKLEFNETLLQEIAKETGGQYFHALDKDNLSKVYNSINQLEKSTIKITTYNRFEDKFQYLLWASLCLLVIEVLLKLTVCRKFP
jgi:Ca-activated chloride channel family protein